jgi:hypothetical protein
VSPSTATPTQLVVSLRVGGGELLDLAPVVRAALVAPEDVGRPRAAAARVLADRAHDHVVAADRHAETEEVIGLQVRGRQLLDLPPIVRAALVLLKDIRRPGAAPAGVLEVGAHDDGVAADRDTCAEEIAGLRVGGGDLLDLPPVARSALALFEDVRRPGVVFA